MGWNACLFRDKSRSVSQSEITGSRGRVEGPARRGADGKGRSGEGGGRVEGMGRNLGGRGERLTSFGRLARVTTKHGTKEYHPRTFLENPSRSRARARARAYARSRELYYPRGQSGTLRGHCAKRGTVFQVSNGIFVLRIHAARRGIERVFTRRRDATRRAAPLGFECLLGISNRY